MNSKLIDSIGREFRRNNWGSPDPKVLVAIEKVPRIEFLGESKGHQSASNLATHAVDRSKITKKIEEKVELNFQNESSNILQDYLVTTLSQVHLVAYMLTNLIGKKDIRGKCVLVLGFGTGYDSALLAFMGAKVTGFDMKDLRDAAYDNIAKAGVGTRNIKFYVGDWRDYITVHKKTYDLVIVSYAMPRKDIALLLSAIGVGGRAVVPVQLVPSLNKSIIIKIKKSEAVEIAIPSSANQRLTLYKKGESFTKTVDLGSVRFVPNITKNVSELVE